MSFILCKYCENRRQEPPRGKHHGKRCVNCKKRHCHHGSDTCSPACDMENLTKVMRQVRAEENHVTRRHRQKALAAAWTKDKRRAASRSMMEIRADVNLEQHRSASQSDAWHNKTKRDRRKIATKISISRRMVRRKIVRAAKDAYRRKSPEAKTASLANLKLGRPALAKIRRGMPTRPERVLHRILRHLGVTFLVEYPIGRYHADAYVPEHRTVFEADGTYWHSRPGAARRDARRNCYMEKHGYQVVRFDDEQLLRKPKAVKREIRAYLGLDKG